MAEKDQSAAAKPANGGQELPVQPRVQILTQYIRDLSFENIAAQNGSNLQGQTAFDIQVNLDAKKLEGDTYEVINKLTITAKAEEAQIFILEIDFAGRFNITNVPDDQIHPFLMIECPRILFPYLRRVVGDITRDGGYPPLNLDNIDYVALYRNEITRRAQEQAKNQPVS